MNRQLGICVAAGLAVIGVTGCILGRVQGHQRLASPGVVTHALPGSIRLCADLPAKVLDYSSQELETEDVTINVLPSDTSFGWRRYKGSDNFVLDLRVVLMGHDRTSLHRPQFCLTGQGWQINQQTSREMTVKMEQPLAYDLPVVALMTTKTLTTDGQSQLVSGVYVYWYVADGALSASTSGLERTWKMAATLVRTGVLQRWAYVSCFAPCAPGQEVATLDRVKRFISAAAPQFQLYPTATTKLVYNTSTEQAPLQHTFRASSDALRRESLPTL
jgi:hypothetical protein